MTVDALLYQAVMAEKCGRYNEMVAIANKMAKAGQLDKQERGVFTEAYRLAIGKLRTASRLMDQIYRHKGGRQGAAEVTRQYKDKIDGEIRALCKQCLDALAAMRSASGDHHHAFLAKENADIHRYLAEIDASKMNEAAKAYEDAVARSDVLPSGDPLRLAIHMNYAVFQYELLRERDRAIATAERALGETYDKVNNREETVMRALIQKNLLMWRE
eukprot:Gregarina_sp_Poly_1__4211@NODE_22_length_20656_cov_110_706397_g20_i0_p8_GENE_NODE_22_length_20656_cov_110_706397_g20_i0NODE_22_length_20656_cov_110_706397_g20_i0_p8_ORF_typecomplete_len216_score25_211433/PF00244_20/1_2e32DUF3856/PF12968_7/1_9e03DUF3856/PF12968_7/0_00031TPR_19/PF14559_6/4_4e03TPR_19/PF14559_6/9_4e03TPR_19/PF14559_6/1_3e03TPR_19/PF14559_6/0_019TPR_16/PF13432_6/2_7e02TPR_16/PF13432_6/4_2e02TPR_16/PF13432_6/0_05TTRAP/PF14203_6/0_54TTRAP/PF14203_6/2_5e03GlnD_UR_UTase/PF08335_11/0_3Gl